MEHAALLCEKRDSLRHRSISEVRQELSTMRIVKSSRSVFVPYPERHLHLAEIRLVNFSGNMNLCFDFSLVF